MQWSDLRRAHVTIQSMDYSSDVFVAHVAQSSTGSLYFGTIDSSSSRPMFVFPAELSYTFLEKEEPDAVE